MALDLQAPNFSGLAALAGTRVGGLGLAVPRSNLATGLASGMNAGMDRADRRSQMAAQQALAQQELGMKQAQNQQMMDYRNRALDMQGQMQGRQMEMDERRLQQQERIAGIKEMNETLKLRAAETDERLNRRGALASSFIVGYKQAQSPEEQDKIKTEMLGHALELGVIDDDEYQKLDKLSPQSLYNKSLIDLMVTDKAKDLKSLMGGPMGSGALSGDRQEPAKPTVNEQQKDIASGLQTIKRLEKIGEDYQHDYLTWGGKLKSVYGNTTSGAPEMLKNLFYGQEEAEKFAEGRTAFAAELNQMVAAYVKSMSGVAYGMKELEMHKQSLVNSGDSPAEFRGKFKMMMDVMRNSMNIRQELLKEGIPVNSDKFNKEYENRMAPLVDKLNQSVYTKGDQTYTDKDIDETAAHYGISREEVLKRMGY